MVWRKGSNLKGWLNSCDSSAWGQSMQAATRTNSPAGSASASALRARWRWSRGSSSATSPYRPPQGCRFHTRCPHARERCREEEPPLAAADGHFVACHFWKEIEPFTSASRLTPVNERLTRLQAAFHTGGGSS